MNNGIYKADQLTFWSEEHPANPSASQDLDKDSKTQEATLCLHTLQSLNVSSLDGLCGKMSLVSCHLTEEKILESSSGRWANSGMGSHTAFLTLSTSEWPKDAEESLLSHTLEVGKLPQRYYLSKIACQGILRRANKRGKKLPQMLKDALEAVAFQGSQDHLTQNAEEES
jgi:hypothetical protein